MTENFICQRCSAKVLGEAYDNNDVQCVEEEHYDCKCGFSWHWAYGYHLSESTIYQENPECSKVDVAYVCGGYKQFRVQTSTQDANITKWSNKIALISKCTPKDSACKQLKLLGSLIAQDLTLDEGDKNILREIWKDAFDTCKKRVIEAMV